MERLWAGWRNEYVTSASPAPEGGDTCVLCRVAGAADEDGVAALWRGEVTVAVLNAYPYTSGHLMVLPIRHVGELEDLDDVEAAELWDGVRCAVAAVKAAYRPEGVNVGANLGRAAGAGVPGHLHLHVLPRWSGDTNFMTSVAEARVLPESLPTSGERLRAAWPQRASPSDGEPS